MKYQVKKFISIIIVVSMLLSLIPLTSAALDDEFEGLETLEEVPFEFELEPGDLPWEQLGTATLAASDIPACISPALAEARGHVNRLYLQEPDDYTVMFQNRDGSKTIYVFSYPVKSTGMSMHTTATIQVSGSAISFASGNIITSRIGVDLFDYNIGYCEVQTFFGGMLTADGVNITEDARGWARSESSAGNLVYNMSGAAAAEYNMNMSSTANATLVPGITITPIDPTPSGGITVMSISYSALAGYMSFKNVSNNQFLTYSGSTNSLTTTIPIYTPSSIWQVTYEGSYTFRVRCLENALDTYIGLNSSSNPQLTIGLKDDSLTHTDLFLDAVAENGQVKVTILSREYGDMALSTNNSFYTLGEGEDDFPTTCQWIITNKHNYALVTNLTKLSDTRIEQTGLGFEMDYTKLPATTVYENIGLYFEHNGEEVPLDPDSSEDEPMCVIDEPGIYTVYYMDIATGVSSENFILIVTASAKNYGEKETYSITHAVYTSNSKPLYLSRHTTNGLMLSTKQLDGVSVDRGDNLPHSVLCEELANVSRTFIFRYANESQEMADGVYITATMSTSQYGETPSGSQIDSPGYTYTGPYSVIDSDTVANTIEYIDSNNIKYISLVAKNNGGTLFKLLDMGSHYLIVYDISISNNSLVIRALKSNSANNGVEIGYYDGSDAFKWNINQVGVDAPAIKQVNRVWCGPTSFLQVLYGMDVDVEGNNLSAEQTLIKNTWGMSNSAVTTNHYKNYMNGYKTGSDNNMVSITRWLPTKYTCVEIANPSESELRTKIRSSLDAGAACIIFTVSGGKPYKSSYSISPGSTLPDGHFICVIGYDEVSDTVILSNCHYSKYRFGIHEVDFTDFCEDVGRLFYFETSATPQKGIMK